MKNQKASKFLSQFDLHSLGDGDPVARINTIVAVACAIANLSRPESGLGTKEGRLIEVGTNFATTGGKSATLVQEVVFQRLSRLQENYTMPISKNS
jgi:hypothetical protein